MLAEFQQAMCDLTASPALVGAVRANPSVLAEAYDLTDRETRRLAALAADVGMTASCSLYRANRLAPLVMNAPRTCRALAPQLRGLLDQFWSTYTETNVHFFVETERFCAFVERRIAAGLDVAPDARVALTEEAAVVRRALAESHLERTGA